MSQTAAHLVDHVIPHGPERQWVLSLPIPLRLLLAAQPELVRPVLQVVRRVVTRHLLGQAGLATDEGYGGAVTLIQRFAAAQRAENLSPASAAAGVPTSGHFMGLRAGLGPVSGPGLVSGPMEGG